MFHHIWQLRQMAGLQAVPIVNKSSFSEMVIPKASRTEQFEIAQRYIHSLSLIEKESKEKAKLEKLKSGLMDDLLTGRVRVTDLLTGED
jgi:type I restriction enzyme S subunit